MPAANVSVPDSLALHLAEQHELVGDAHAILDVAIHALPDTRADQPEAKAALLVERAAVSA